MASEEEVSWEFKESGGYLYAVDGKARFELGPVEAACEKMADYLAKRDFGDATNA